MLHATSTAGPKSHVQTAPSLKGPLGMVESQDESGMRISDSLMDRELVWTATGLTSSFCMSEKFTVTCLATGVWGFDYYCSIIYLILTNLDIECTMDKEDFSKQHYGKLRQKSSQF